jgi:hypothetical protein
MSSEFKIEPRIGYVSLPGHPKGCDCVGRTHSSTIREFPTPLRVEFKNGPLPICPQCKDTSHVVNPQKGPYPSVLECSKCEIEWNGHGRVFPVKKYQPVESVL